MAAREILIAFLVGTCFQLSLATVNRFVWFVDMVMVLRLTWRTDM